MRFLGNVFVKSVYKAKFYIQITRGQIGWFTSMVSDIVLCGIAIKFLGFDFTREQVVIFIPILFMILFVIGFIWYKLGLYNVETLVNVSKDPYQNEVYVAAKRYNDEHNKGKH